MDQDLMIMIANESGMKQSSILNPKTFDPQLDKTCIYVIISIGLIGNHS